ncbi:MAG: GWxTD domain-containing protein [Bacteroidota bacterium]
MENRLPSILGSIAALIISLSCPQLMWAQWEVGVYEIGSSSGNVTLYLQVPSAHLEAPLEMCLTFRNPTSLGITSQKCLQFSSDSSLFVLPLVAPLGKSRLFVDISNSQQGVLFETEVQLEVLASSDLALTDLLLSHRPFVAWETAYPLFSPISTEISKIFYGMEVNSAAAKDLSARIILYKKMTANTAQYADRFEASTQQNLLSNSVSNRHFFSGSIQVDTLSPGDYLLEALIYQEDQLMGEKSRFFTKKWEGAAWLAAHPDSALRWATPILPPTTRQSYEGMAKDELHQALMSWWEDRFGSEASTEYEAYYQRVMTVNKKFSERRAGWQTDRGKTWILFGKPDDIQEINRQGRKQIKWTYTKWPMVFWFEWNGDTYRKI